MAVTDVEGQVQKQFTITPPQFTFIKRLRFEHDLPHSTTVRMALDVLMEVWEDPLRRELLLEQLRESS